MRIINVRVKTVLVSRTTVSCISQLEALPLALIIAHVPWHGIMVL